MAKYAVSKEFKDLNIGFTLDEGLASEDNAIPLFYGERNVFWVQFKCKGKKKFSHVQFFDRNNPQSPKRSFVVVVVLGIEKKGEKIL